MDRALKSNFLTKFAMKSTQQALFDDLFYVNGATFSGGGGGGACDDFSVDTFLDLSNGDFNEEGFVGEEEGGEQGKGNSSSSNFSGDFDSGSLAAGELSVPVEDIDQLEWLSQFVDDSPSELSLLFPPAGICKEKNTNGSKLTFEPPIKPLAPAQISQILQFPSPVPSKPRSKRSRSRPSGQPWSTALLLLKESSSSVKPAAKKQRKWQGGEGGGSQSQRRCSHCGVQKTPQWRSGPLGEKTLCNACGVRYKSGRLFPEYRPACSPTFLESVHSNSHRKVLEMRMKKELVGPGSDLTSMVPNLEMHLNRVASF